MRDVESQDNVPLPATVLARLLEVYDRYEAAWRAGHRPRIEDYLELAPASGRVELLRMIQGLERELRGGAERTLTLTAGADETPVGGAGARDDARANQTLWITLTVTAGPHAGRVFRFEEHDSFLVGRDKTARFRLARKDEYVSRHHFLVELNPPHCRLIDVESTNGTQVNGQPVETAELRHGDQIRVGKTVLTVALAGAEDVADQDPPPAIRKESTDNQPPMVAGYQLVRELGRGGMGCVFLAIRGDEAAPVALKTILPAVAGSKAQVGRFLREANILRELDHPGIVSFRDLGESDGLLYFAMDYVLGTDAAKLLKEQGGPLPIGRAVGLVLQVLDALGYAHGRGFVHRDIKPANLLVARDSGHDAVKLADFGLARVYRASRLSGLTLKGDMAGTLGYMAPEQITRFRESDPAVDQYAAGATLYKLLTDRAVHDLPRSLNQQIRTVLEADPVPVHSRRGDLPRGLCAVIHRALAREPKNRFADVAALRAALAPFA
jgi:serine/threonine-protein kinase